MIGALVLLGAAVHGHRAAAATPARPAPDGAEQDCTSALDEHYLYLAAADAWVITTDPGDTGSLPSRRGSRHRAREERGPAVPSTPTTYLPYASTSPTGVAGGDGDGQDPRTRRVAPCRGRAAGQIDFSDALKGLPLAAGLVIAAVLCCCSS